MNKKTIYKIFKFFSILLILNFTLIPLISFILGIDNECEYGIIACVGTLVIFLLILVIFWLLSWWNIYVIFIRDSKIINFRDVRFSLIKFDIWLTQKWFCGKSPLNRFRRGVITSIVAIECLGILYLLFVQLFEVFKIFIQKL